MSKTNSRIARLDFWRANVSLFEDLLGRITSISCPWDSCPIFKSCLLKTELVHSKSQKDEQAWYKASIDEQDALNWPQIQKRSMQKVETGPGLPGWNIEILPKSAGRDLGKPKLSWCCNSKECEGQRKGILWKMWTKYSTWQGELLTKGMGKGEVVKASSAFYCFGLLFYLQELQYRDWALNASWIYRGSWKQMGCIWGCWGS